MNLSQARDTEIKERISDYIANERNFSGDLVAHWRTTIHKLIKKNKIKK